jgi:tetratricopeptide (TPR) repeat protein
MAEPNHRLPPPEQSPPPPKSPLPWASLLPLALVWGIALLPLVLYLLQTSDPVLAVETANALTTWSIRLVLGGGALSLLALIAYPPFPAWLRRFLDRIRRSWTVDCAPLQQALKDLEHFETAQKHFEVARLSWIRTDMMLVGPHAARAVELDPSMAQAHHLLGQYLHRVGALPQALLAFEAAERLDPGHAFGDSLLLQARVLFELGRHDQALERFAEHQRTHGGGHRSDYWRGEALAAAGRSQEAGDAFRAAARDPKQKLPAEANWFRALARVKCWRYGGKA